MTVILILLMLVAAGVKMPKPLRGTPVEQAVETARAEIDTRFKGQSGVPRT